jgi:hypothetical protein
MSPTHLLPQHVASFQLGWLLVLAGFVSGAMLGLGFHRADFLGGYASLRRRLVRLGHIACVALGVLNVLHALAPWPAPGSVAAQVAGAGLALGGVAMPLVCFLAAWRPSLRHLFALPVASLVAALLAIVLAAPGARP